jgi:hypothetical protein
MTALWEHEARAISRRRRRTAPQGGTRAAPAALAGALLLLLCGPACALRGQDEDWYKVLGVPRTAESSAIRLAYRKLVLKWHPGAFSPRRAARARCARPHAMRRALPAHVRARAAPTGPGQGPLRVRRRARMLRSSDWAARAPLPPQTKIRARRRSRQNRRRA